MVGRGGGWAFVCCWAGLGWVAGLGWPGLRRAGWGWVGWAIGLLENGKVVSRPKNELPDGQQQQAISIYFFLEGLGFGVQGLGLVTEATV